MAHKTAVMISSFYRTIAIMTVITTVIWTAVGVYSALNKPSEQAVDPLLLQPLSAAIDTETINALATRRQLTDEVTSESVVQQAISILLVEPSEEQPTEQQTVPTQLEEPSIEDTETVPPTSTPAATQSVPETPEEDSQQAL